MRILADQSFTDALSGLPSAVRYDAGIALQQMLAAPTLNEFAATGRELLNLTSGGFSLQLKDNYQNAVGVIDGFLEADGKWRLTLKSFY